MSMGTKIRGTTIVAVRRDGCVAVAGDGQVTVESTILKSTARKVQRLADGQVLTGFAGAVADAMTLFEKFRARLEESSGNLKRAAVELAKEWRSDKFLRQLNALLVVADREDLLLISGTGDVIAPDDDVIAIGSGGAYALTAARALLRHTDLPAGAVAREALRLAAEVCIYTNDQITCEELPAGETR
ncbi:MAG: ATP-dependent protease subunit HslV [Fimbriimonadaceae bacterium]|nr:ATP-dependent protease subunit HslV [Fimbriimonadaceae bacterium]